MADARTEKQKVKEITDRLEEGLKELFEGEKYKSYLNTMSKFHNYSANNIQLIEMQCPDATYVAGYRAWQRNFERHVNKGERGIRILAPAPYKIKEEQEKIDPVTNEPVLDRDGMPVMEEVEIKIPAFRVVTVFDYSQTDGKELPGLGVNELHGDVERYRDFMEALERVSPVPIRYEEMEGDRKGYFIDLSRPIAIKEGMSEAQTAKTGVHEVAHAKLHAREAEQDTEKAVYKDRETKEVEAESIAYTVCQHFGIDTSDYSFGYIAGWSSGKEMPELKSSLDTIRRTSSELIKGIEAQLLEIEKERAAEQSQEDIILLVSNTDRSEYDLLNVKGMERTEIFNLLSAMKDDDRQNVEAYLERAGAWVTLLANERSEEVGEYHLDYAYDTDTHEITDYKALQEERERANVPIEYGDVIVRISTPDSGEYETIKIADMQSEVANVLYAIPFLEENEWNGNVLDYLQERGFEFVPIMRSGGLNDGYPQFYDFDVDMSEWEVHTASELPATVQAEQLINRMEFHRSVYDSDERNLIMNHAYRLDDMYKTTSLAHSIAEQKDDSALLWETIRVAQEEIDALPDGMVGLSEMHEYGYSWDEMLPLTKDMASELFGEDVSVYQLHADGSETLVEDRAALQEHDGLFGVEKGDWNAYKEYLSMKQELEDSEPNREAQLLYGNEGRFGIYQLKDSAETRDIRFMDMDYLEKEGIPVSRENYTLVYTGELTEGMSLEDIYTKFNIDHPADFTGHSLSVSDVVVLHQDGENTSHYVDSVGYREIPEFTKELSVSVEISTEKDAVREETAEIPAEAAEEHTAAENTMAEPDNDKVSYYVIEDLSTWAENSPEKSRLERFESLSEAMEKFTEYRGKETEDKPDMARATFGFHVNGSEFDLIHVRNHENCLSLDFTHSKAAEESSRFMEDLQTLNHEVGFDKVRVHREMSPEEIKDFVKQRFEYQLKSSGLDDISLYMDRFDALYGQGKMEHLMPTANQKHIVEDVPFTEWENPYIDANVREADRVETELAFRLADRYISIQEATEGYDYTIYDMDYRELDGGVYDNPDITIRQALDEIVTDLKEPAHRSSLEGSIRTDDELIPIDYDGLIEKAEQAAKEHLEERIRTEVPEAVESKVIADFKARTEELFNPVNGQTQEDIEMSVYAYLQSKIDEYGMDIELVDMAVTGSRCRGLEEPVSDLDVAVEYRGGENEDTLFNAFNEDGFTIGGVKVDINPITEGKTGTLGEYLPGVEAYLEEKRAALQEKAAEQAQEEKQTVVTLTVAECGEFHNFGEYHEGIADVPEAIAIFNRIPPERMNGIPSIGINIHTEGTESYEDTQMDIVSGRVADLEILDYVPDITDNPKAVEVIAELIDKLPDIEVRGSLEKWQAAFLAAEIDQLSYNYDTVQYNQTVEDREAQIANITEDIRNGNTGYLNDFLNALISDSIREGMTDIIGKGTELDDSEGVQTARKAKELLDKLAEYKPLAKIEELEECNYNMIDNVLNNEKPKEEKQAGRISIKEKLAEKKAVIEQRDKSDKEVPEKGTEKKSEREI
ncbi:DUF4316 domain-containing protein [Lachnospiraceae bacterium WCA-9-b2]|uniref:DUF4316 domain-containing protein n=1 Tax=Sporofaciens musculi TaxID=2681861 RepID=A0A7X3SHZ5_9FIRM|nr:YodL domain-containing protein [Sporofaciens musculi]MXP74591.1 DUF4316 domain-containing protein [Sporofaciens musculi]